MPERPASAGLPGSPSGGEPVYLVVGQLRRPHGVRGDLLMEVHTDFPERLMAGVRVFVGESHAQMTVARVRPHNDGLLVGFRGIETPEAAGKLRNLVVMVMAKDRPPLSEGKYYHHQLIGLRVQDESENTLGLLSEILVTGANDVYVVTSETGQELLLPAIEDVILGIDIKAGILKVHLIPGLVESQSKE